MTAVASLPADSSLPGGVLDLDVVIPVYNEEAVLEASVRRLHDYLTTSFPFPWVITIADNASRDQTGRIARRLAEELCGVRVIHLDAPGRGRALRAAWSASTARVVAYTDVDLSTDLGGLLPLVAPLLSGHSDVAIGSRLSAGARVVRGPRREVISRAYNLILRATLHSGFSDAQCGFKAVRSEVARALLPLVEDEGWFFDTELLVLAERNGLRIHEVPVDWVDDPDSRVDVVSTACGDLKGIARMIRCFASGKGVLPVGSLPRGRQKASWPGQLLLLAGSVAASAGLFAVVVALLAGDQGPTMAAWAALAAVSVLNLWVHRPATTASARPKARHHLLGGMAVSALPAVVTTGAALALQAAGVRSVGVDVLVLTSVMAAASVARILITRSSATAEISPAAGPTRIPRRSPHPKRATASEAANSTIPHDRARSASSVGASRDRSSMMTEEPSIRVMRPSTWAVRRRMSRAGVLNRRWALERATAAAAASTAAVDRLPVCATYPVNTGNAPHASAKPASVWIRPPNNSRL
jgi:hypothetical protein